MSLWPEVFSHACSCERSETKDLAHTRVTTSGLEILNCSIVSFENGEVVESLLYESTYETFPWWPQMAAVRELPRAADYSVDVLRAPDITPHSITCWRSAHGSRTTSPSVTWASTRQASDDSPEQKPLPALVCQTAHLAGVMVCVRSSDTDFDFLFIFESQIPAQLERPDSTARGLLGRQVTTKVKTKVSLKEMCLWTPPDWAQLTRYFYYYYFFFSKNLQKVKEEFVLYLLGKWKVNKRYIP